MLNTKPLSASRSGFLEFQDDNKLMASPAGQPIVSNSKPRESGFGEKKRETENEDETIQDDTIDIHGFYPVLFYSLPLPLFSHT